MRTAWALAASAMTVLALAGTTVAYAGDESTADSSAVAVGLSGAADAGTGAGSATVDATSALPGGPAAAAVASTPPSSSALSSSSPSSTPTSRDPVPAPDSRRVIVYYQKHYENDPQRTGYISALPLLTENTGVDVINLAAIHMNKDPKDPTRAVLNLNDDLPSDPMYDRMWTELHHTQGQGIPVIAMIGGAVNDTWPNLHSDFETQYAQLRDFVRTYRLDGIDLDIELDQEQIEKGLTIDIDTVVAVIDRLRADFGPDFLITSSPVMDEFGPGDPDDPDSDPSPDGIYGVDFNELYRQRGDQIAWFNLQAYCGHGLPTPDYYDAVIDYQQRKGAQIPPEKLVIAALTNQENCGSGWVPLEQLTTGLTALVERYPDFGGVAGWEYFNSQPGGTARPWEWAARMRAALDADPTPTTTPAPGVVPPAAAPTVTGPTTLAATGVDVRSLTAIGAVTTLLGAAALLSRRRPRTPKRR